MADKVPKAAASLHGPSLADRAHARLSVVGGGATGVVSSPEPLWTGSAHKAERLANGLLLLGGAMVEARGESPWDVPAPSPAWSDALHGFDWLDDAVAASPELRRELMVWLHDWVARYGAGGGPGWRPDLTGRRLARWICHAPVLLNGATSAQSRGFFRAIGRQTRFLRRRWRAAPRGLPRFHAAAGLIYAGLAVEGASGKVIREGVEALARECGKAIAADGGIASRNPQELAEIFALLVWAARSLEENGLTPAQSHRDAIVRIAPALRALRLGDGGLARFHGGGAGDPEKIDRALAASGLRAGERRFQTMGFHRITTNRSTLIFDGGRKGVGEESEGLHASAFCFEASVGRRPMIVNCGPGAGFGDEWRMAARATAAHSGLTIDNVSSSLLVTNRRRRAPRLTGGARKLTCVREEDDSGVRLIAEHDGYLASHGLIHQRRLHISPEGGDFRGEDAVTAEGAGPRAMFDQASGRGDRMSVPFTIRFHLHPDIEADVFLAGSAVRLRPPSGDIWVMRQLGGDLTVEDSVYLDDRRVRPRATKQIVVRAEAKAYAGLVKWAFRRAEPEKPAPRDLGEEAELDA